MSLATSFETSGNWLFRKRSYLPLILFLVVIPAMAQFRYPQGSHELDLAWELFCLAISMLGLILRAYVVGTTPTGTSGRNTHGQVAEVLNTTGVYSVVRHPLYVGNYLMWMGIALFPRSTWLALVVSLAFWLYYERIMFAEEAFLRGKFGTPFDEWAARTPAFLPNLKLWVKPSLPFSWRMVLRREYSGLYAVIASFTVLEVLGDAIIERTWEFDPVWMMLFGVTTVLYLTLLSLKRYTQILTVRGR